MSEKNERPEKERFWENVGKGGDSECWEWTAGCNGQGYGELYIDGEQNYTHRLSYKWHCGDPDGLNVLHHCDNPPCVNPKHLYAGTQGDNIQDAYDRNRREKKLSDEDRTEIKARYGDGANQYDLAEEYGVQQSMISMVVNGRA